MPERMRVEIAAVVVTCGRKSLLEGCIRAIQCQEGASCDILVVDNASDDGTMGYMEGLTGGNWKPGRLTAGPAKCTERRIMYLRLSRNTGGAGGFHYGIKAAYRLGYKYLWLMDDDAEPDSHALSRLMEADRRLGGGSAYGFLSGAVLWTDGSICQMNRPRPVRGGKISGGLAPLEHATFVSLFLPASTVAAAGLPLREYFVWGDDIEYTRRIAVRLGMPSYLVLNSRTVHRMDRNVGSRVAFDSPGRIGRYRLAFRNDFSTYRREGISGVAYYLGKWCKNMAETVFLAKDRKTGRMAALIKGFMQGLAFSPRIEYAEME